MKTAIDTNVLLDLFAGSDESAGAAKRVIASAMGSGPVVISPVVYAELAVAFDSEEELHLFLGDLQIQMLDFTPPALLSAADAWRQHRRGRDQTVQCPKCGERATVACPSCGHRLSWRQHIITDFLIGGHALHQADRRILTRDRGYFRTCFPALEVIEP